MREIPIDRPEGLRFVPENPTGVGVLVVAGSSGRLDPDRARLFGGLGAIAETIRWFGGADQQPGPWLVPVETFTDRVTALSNEADRIVLVGTSFGAEAALLAGSLDDRVDAVIGFAPSDVVWAGVDGDGTQHSHWTLDGEPVPFVAYDDAWTPEADGPPAFRGLYAASRRVDPMRTERATIAAERIPDVVLVAGGDDQVWASVEQAARIADRRTAHGRATAVVTDDDAGHRTILPGEPVVSAGQSMARGGTEDADRALGARAWQVITATVRDLVGGPDR